MEHSSGLLYPIRLFRVRVDYHRLHRLLVEGLELELGAAFLGPVVLFCLALTNNNTAFREMCDIFSALPFLQG